jgi:hypothetical protein
MIQDDKREKEIIKILGLKQNLDRKRHDIDAFLKFGKNNINFELKSSTVGSISSASPLTLDHIKKWRTYHWIFGIYDKNTEKLQHCVYASPKMMKPWLDSLESDINRGIHISYKLVTKIDKKMMHLIFGKKKVYSFDEAKKVYKKLYSPEMYKKLQDRPNGYSEKRMLFMFREHNLSYLIRGSWLNNPKIPKEYYKNFPKITKKWKTELKNILKEHI